MRLKPLPVSRLEYEQFGGLQKKPHKGGWWAVFSVNGQEEVWPFVCYGLTPLEKRELVPLEEYPCLRDIAGIVIERTDGDGGRFFIDTRGVFGIKGDDENSSKTPAQFIEWRPDEPLPDKQAAVPSHSNAQAYDTTPEEVLAMVARNTSTRRRQRI